MPAFLYVTVAFVRILGTRTTQKGHVEIGLCFKSVTSLNSICRSLINILILYLPYEKILERNWKSNSRIKDTKTNVGYSHYDYSHYDLSAQIHKTHKKKECHVNFLNIRRSTLVGQFQSKNAQQNIKKGVERRSKCKVRVYSSECSFFQYNISNDKVN